MIFSERTPLILRLMCSAFAVLGGVGLVKIVGEGTLNTRHSWLQVAMLCLLELLFLSTWILKLEISYDKETRRLIVNRTGWREKYLAGDITDVFYVRVSGFLHGGWSVNLKRGARESWVVNLQSEEAAKTLVRDIRTAVGLPGSNPN
ncbi:MAG TPA: hypothetical protein VJS20_09205 [Gemmatimonadales bacterium]|nr:hypothetical protein [Gemmatimonadales bacterium]